MNWMIQAIKEGIWTILLIAGPIVTVAASIGLTVGLVQTVTNIQDQTTPTALKILAIFILLGVGGTWMFNQMRSFTTKTVGKAFHLAILERNPVGDDGVRNPTLATIAANEKEQSPTNYTGLTKVLSNADRVMKARTEQSSRHINDKSMQAVLAGLAPPNIPAPEVSIPSAPTIPAPAMPDSPQVDSISMPASEGHQHVPVKRVKPILANDGLGGEIEGADRIASPDSSVRATGGWF